MVTAPAIEAFWAWWHDTGRAQCDEAIGSGSLEAVRETIDGLVEAISPGLQCELGKGGLSANVLCMSGAGNAALRPTAERWLMAAPPSDESWEFRSARPPDLAVFEEGVSFRIDGQDLAPAELRIFTSVDDDRQVMDVSMWHPDLAGADGELRQTAMSLMLDWLLGEDATERWIGSVDFAESEPPNALTPQAFMGEMEDLERSNLEPTYALMSGTIESRPVMIVARRPLKSVEFPLFDLRIDARVMIDDATPEGFPTPMGLESLTVLEEDLSARLGDLGIVAAVLTRDAVRTFYIYCDQEGRAPAIAQTWVAEHPEETIVLSFELDPAWETVAPFC